MGTESNGRDMLAVLLVGAPKVTVDHFCCRLHRYVDRHHPQLPPTWAAGWTLSSVPCRTRSSIPALAVLIVIAAYVRTVSIESMALLLALFASPAPMTAYPCPVLVCLSAAMSIWHAFRGASSFDIMFKDDAQ